MDCRTDSILLATLPIPSVTTLGSELMTSVESYQLRTGKGSEAKDTAGHEVAPPPCFNFSCLLRSA